MKRTPAPDLELYGFYGSFCTQKVMLALAEKGQVAAYTSVNIGPPMSNYEPWYARINPRMVVPTLRHGDLLVSDSAQIVYYIDNELSGPALQPAKPAARKQVNAIVAAIDELPIRELSYGSMRGALRHFRDRVLMPRRLRLLRRARLQAPELAHLYDARIADVVRWSGELVDPAAHARAQAALEAQLSRLETRLPVGSGFLVGDSYTLADLMSTVLVARLKAMSLADLDAYPKLLAHYGRMRARPNFPSEDIVERISLRRVAPIVLPFVLPRLLLALTVLGLTFAALYHMLTA